MENSAEAIALINDKILDAATSGKRATVAYKGPASLLIHNVDPLVYERYGRFRNRGPQLVGRFTLLGLISYVSEDRSTVYPYAVVDVNRTLYGIPAGGDLLNQLSKAAGLGVEWVTETEY